MAGNKSINLNLKKFPMEKIGRFPICVVIGKRNSGKSYLIKHFMNLKKQIPCGMVMSGTEEVNNFYSEFIPDIFIYEDYDTEALTNMFEQQKEIIEIDKIRDRKKRRYNKNDKIIKYKRNDFFLILDDLMFDNSKWKKDKSFKKLFMNGRHYQILFLLSLQYPLGILPNLRTNVDYIFILRDNNYQNKKKIYESYAGMFPNFDTFRQVMDAVTEDFGVLVIDNTSKSNVLTDIVYWYRAPSDIPKFKVGSKEFWKQAKLHYKEQKKKEKEKEKSKTLKDLALKKNAYKIKVNKVK